MLWVETGGEEAQNAEDLAVFVTQLNALGHHARICHRSVPSGLSRNAQFDIAPYLIDGLPTPDDQVVVVAAQRIGDRRLAQLRRFTSALTQPGVAFGSFASRQMVIAARAKLSYVLGRDPHVFDLTVGAHSPDELGHDCPVLGARIRSAPASRPRVLVVEPDLAGKQQAAALVALGLSRSIDLAVLTDSKTKQEWIGAYGRTVPFYHYGETLPSTLAAHCDALVSFRPLNKNYRLQTLVANLEVLGAALIDGSEGYGVASWSDAFIRGPIDLQGLGTFLTAEILPNLDAIRRQVSRSAAAARIDGAKIARLFLGASDEPARRPPASRNGRGVVHGEDRARVIFVPTNGIGLGHAQRCALIASKLDRRRAASVFAVFPSCTRLVKSYGFDAMPLIARSSLHAQAHENDLANYLRLRALAEGKSALVFDGGYVFDSVYRTILERDLRGVWIRRGLWRPEQNNAVSLDREKAFARVIIPTEAFGELNKTYSLGGHVRSVGPIVQRVPLDAAQRAEIRSVLAAKYDLTFDHLIITKLGSGVAADRTAQIQALCVMLERRRDVLHLVVAWPTGTQEAGWFGWSRSRVVTTLHAGALALAADVCISAAGYNSFHEMLYGRIPAIFLPQTAPFMDDQRARAQAALERDVAGLVEPHELITLEKEIVRFLDNGHGAEIRHRLFELDLPTPGTAEAARMIEEILDGHAATGPDPVQDRASGGG